MKRKIITAGILIIFFICVAISIMYFNKQITLIKDIDVENIEKIALCSNGATEMLYSKKNILEIMNILQSMTLKKSVTGEKKEGFVVDVYFVNDEKLSLTVLTNEVYIDGEKYKCDIDCVDKLKKIYVNERDKINLSDMNNTECYHTLKDYGLVVPKQFIEEHTEEELAEQVKFYADYTIKNNWGYPAYGGLPLSVFAGRVAIATVKYEMSENDSMVYWAIERLQAQEQIYFDKYGED